MSTQAPARLTIPRTPVHPPAAAGAANASGWSNVVPPSSALLGSFRAEDFGDGFDMKAWINQQLASRAPVPAQEQSATPGTPAQHVPSELAATTAHLSSLLMKLQLAASDLNASMEQQSQELVQAMPKAMREIGFIHRESQGLRGNLADILKDMANMEGAQPAAPVQPALPSATTSTPAVPTTPASLSTPSGVPAGQPPQSPAPSSASAADTIEFLQSIDVVQGRILRCAHTLEEIEQWRQRESSIERLFEGMQMQSGGKGAEAGSSDASALVSASSYSDLARLHRELNAMQRIVERFRTLGLGPEHEERVAALAGYQTRLVHLTESCLDQTLEQLQVEGGGAAALNAGAADGAPNADGTGSSNSLVLPLQTLHGLYVSLGKTAAFQSKYQSHKIRPALASQVLNKFTKGASGASASPFDPSNLDKWVDQFYAEVVSFTRGELLFAQQVFGTAPPPQPAANSSLPERSRFPSVADRGEGGATAAGVEANAASTAAGAVGAASSSVSAPSTPSFTFVYSALLDSLHDELVPLLSVWFSTFLSKDAPAGVDRLARLWERSIERFGWPLAQLFFPHATVSAVTTANSSGSSNALHPTSGHLSPIALPVAGDVSASGLRAPQWPKGELHSRTQVLVDLLYQPFLRFLDEYAALERRALLASLDSLALADATPGSSVEESTERISSAQATLLAGTTAATKRCISLSGGVLLEPCLASLQDFYAEFVTRALAVVNGQIRKSAGLADAPPAGKGATAGSPQGKLAAAASADGLSSMLQDSSAAAEAASAELLQEAVSGALFASLFALLASLRQMQTELFAPHAEESLVERFCAGGSALVLQVLRGCEEERERIRGGATGTSAHKALTSVPTPLLSARRNSFAAGNGGATPNLSTGAGGGATPSVGGAAASSTHSPFHSSGDLSRALYVSFLLQHPDRLRALEAFVHRYFLPSHPAALALMLTHTQLSEQQSGQTQGLMAHNLATPATPLLTAASVTTSPVLMGGARYGFPLPGAALSVGSSSPSSSASSATGVPHSHSHLFPSAAASFEQLVQAVQSLLLEVMFSSIGKRLEHMASWGHIWAAGGVGGSAGGSGSTALSNIPLPSFSMQPSDYIIAIGEHMLTLVQQLEPYVRGGDDDEEEQQQQEQMATLSATPTSRKMSTPSSPFSIGTPHAAAAAAAAAAAVAPQYVEHDALYWLNHLSRATFSALLASVMSIPLLSDRGARQLATDLEYLTNVFSALGISIPPIVGKLTHWLGWNETSMAARLGVGAGAGAGGAASPASSGASNEESIKLSELQAEEKQMLRQMLKARRFRSVEQALVAQLNQ